jgi:Tfp pilus assembly protein PilO
MSSTRKPAAAPAKAGRKPGAPPPERKAVKGPAVTPQALGIVFFVILVIGIIVFYNTVVVKFKNQLQALEAQANQTTSQIQTYKQKGEMLDEAKAVNSALREKLNTLDYLFLFNQDSIVPFFENTLFPMIETSRLRTTADSKLEVPEYTYKINMTMTPFNTMPASTYFENPQDLFKIEYVGETNGAPPEGPTKTEYPAFLTPYSIKMVKFGGTYEDVKDFVESVQTKRNDVLITIHCMKNDSGDSYGLYRIVTTWDLQLTVYFMNPEASATGDNPPEPPGAKTC